MAMLFFAGILFLWLGISIYLNSFTHDQEISAWIFIGYGIMLIAIVVLKEIKIRKRGRRKRT